MSTKLTIGMATYDDFHGVYFSIQAIRMYHKEVLSDIEFIVVDNNPSGSHGEEIRRFLTHVPNSKYLSFDKFQSTAIRNFIFAEASSPHVLSMDCHVFFETGVLKKLLEYYEKNPKNKNLLQGPLVYDDLKSISTHFDPIWREEMYGVWATDKRGEDPEAEPFEIPSQGLGVFTCEKDSWLGFNPAFRGFGGEEGYIHEKYRLYGHKALCLPFLRWMHRFGRPDGVKYPLTVENKVRNYFIAWLELYQISKDNSFLKTIVEHFGGRMSKVALEQLFSEASRAIGLSNVFLFEPQNPSFIIEGEGPKEKTKMVARPVKAES